VNRGASGRSAWESFSSWEASLRNSELRGKVKLGEVEEALRGFISDTELLAILRQLSQ